ncbi:hypothetical protein O181_108111 [Austropuccinia psidii MF-1]|uniref:Uncharacterized protein n=1 Tax=Austropuccinia psidii MF-1 TaxID=1389203 RepID=A0A9Q3JU56_9BASI|nr:hypothetical protein [Austropuccinia psidii MF-1]
MSPVHLGNLGIPRKQPEDRPELSRVRRLGSLGHNSEWQETEGNHTTLPSTFQFSRNHKTENWKDMDKALQLHQLLKDLFQWSMDKKAFNLESHWKKLGASFQKICLKEISFTDLMVMRKGWNTNRQFQLLEERETKIRECQATIQAIEEKFNQTIPTLIPSGSKGVNRPDSPVASHHSGTSRSVTKSHHSSQFQVISRRGKGYKGKNKTSLSHRHKDPYPMIQKLLDFVSLRRIFIHPKDHKR